MAKEKPDYAGYINELLSGATEKQKRTVWIFVQRYMQKCKLKERQAD